MPQAAKAYPLRAKTVSQRAVIVQVRKARGQIPSCFFPWPTSSPECSLANQHARIQFRESLIMKSTKGNQLFVLWERLSGMPHPAIHSAFCIPDALPSIWESCLPCSASGNPACRGCIGSSSTNGMTAFLWSMTLEFVGAGAGSCSGSGQAVRRRHVTSAMGRGESHQRLVGTSHSQGGGLPDSRERDSPCRHTARGLLRQVGATGTEAPPFAGDKGLQACIRDCFTNVIQSQARLHPQHKGPRFGSGASVPIPSFFVLGEIMTDGIGAASPEPKRNAGSCAIRPASLRVSCSPQGSCDEDSVSRIVSRDACIGVYA